MNHRTHFTTAESLEPRQLFAAQVVTPMLNTTGDPSGLNTTVNLSQFFNDSDHTFLQFTTELGSYRVQLFDAQKPATVKNFLKYVSKHRLDNTLIHRVDILDTDTSANPITTPPEIIQGGGFSFPGFNQIKTSKPVVNEAQTNGVISNTRGTIAMARTNDPNSATSEWFVNTTDNPGLDPGGFSAEGYAVFGKVLASDMSVIDAIAAQPRFNFGSSTPFTRLPLRNYTINDFNNSTVPGPNSVITTSSVAVIPDVLTYSVSSSDPSFVNPTIENGNLVLSYGNAAGSALITVTATALDGTTASSTFTAGVGQLDVLVGGTGNAKSLSVTDGDGTVSTISVKGAGVANVRLTGSGITQANNKGRFSVGGTDVVIDNIAITGTDESTALTISSKGGSISGTIVNGISADGAIRSISAKGVTLRGGMSTVGLASAVTIAGADHTSIDLGGAPDGGATSLSLGTLVDTEVVVNSPAKSLKLLAATTTDDTAEAIVLNGVDNMSVSGDLAQPLATMNDTEIGSLSVGGNLTADVTARKIGKVSVRGDWVGSTIEATLSALLFGDVATANERQNQAIGTLAVRGAMNGATVASLGSVGAISAGSIVGSSIVAGDTALAGLPTDLGALTPATLNVLAVKGTFSGTNVAARVIGKTSVKSVQTDNAGVPFGFAADSIASLTGQTTAGQKFAVKSAETQAAVDAALSGIALNDFKVVVL